MHDVPTPDGVINCGIQNRALPDQLVSLRFENFERLLPRFDTIGGLFGLRDLLLWCQVGSDDVERERTDLFAEDRFEVADRSLKNTDAVVKALEDAGLDGVFEREVVN